MPYKFLEDVAIADVCIEAAGKKPGEMFEQAGLATTAVMADLKTVKKKLKKTFELESEEMGKLFFEFLEELVYIKDTEGLLFSAYKVKITKKKMYKLKANCYGDKIDMENQTLLADIKAVTLHMFEVKNAQGKWFARFVLDI